MVLLRLGEVEIFISCGFDNGVETSGHGLVAKIIHAADSIVRRTNIAEPLSFDTPDNLEELSRSLDLDISAIEKIAAQLTDKVKEKINLLSIEAADASADYCRAIQQTAKVLASEHTQLSQQQNQLQNKSGHLDLTREFLLQASPEAGLSKIAAKIASAWQKYYQTGPLALYIPEPDQKKIFAVTLDQQGKKSETILNLPADQQAIPTQIQHNFAILSADEHCRWLMQNLPLDFNPEKTRIIPMLFNGNAIGAIIFEFRYPAQLSSLEENFESIASIAAAIELLSGFSTVCFSGAVCFCWGFCWGVLLINRTRFSASVCWVLILQVRLSIAAAIDAMDSKFSSSELSCAG